MKKCITALQEPRVAFLLVGLGPKMRFCEYPLILSAFIFDRDQLDLQLTQKKLDLQFTFYFLEEAT